VTETGPVYSGVMDNGSWVAAFIPLPFVLLVLGLFAAMILIGLLFAFNQIVGLIVSGTLTHIRLRKTTAVEEPSHSDGSLEIPQQVGGE
jgi:hypothetical protein